MKKVIMSLMILFGLSASLHAETNNFLHKNFWEQKDKREHFTGSFILSSTIVPAIYYNTVDKKPTRTEVFFTSLGATILIGWLKEVNDGTGRGNKDINDLDADVLGALLGAFCHIEYRW